MSSTTKSSLKLSFLTILSRCLGLLRDHFQAFFFGTGPVAFAWEIAILLPGILRNLLIEGGAAQAFIPIYTRSLSKSKKEASKTAGIIVSFIFLIMLGITLLSILTTPYILPLITQQTAKEAIFIIDLSWILLLFMLPASLTSIMAGIINAHRHFFVPALAPIVLNIGMLVGFYNLEIGGSQEKNAFTLAWFFVFSSFIQLFIQYYYICKNKFEMEFSLNLFHPAIKKVIYIMLPAIASTAIFSINQLIDVAIASYYIPLDQGGVPGLRFAQRLIQLPTGIIGVALSTAILPILSYYLSKGSIKKGHDECLSAFQFALFLTVPATIGFTLLGEDIITLLFHGGSWGKESTLATWNALQFYLIAIPIYSLNKIITSIFFSFRDTKTPLRSMFVSTFCNFIMNLILVQFMQQGGIALSTAIAAIIYFSQILFFLQKKHMKINWSPFFIFLRKSLFLWYILVFYLIFVNVFLTPYTKLIGMYFFTALDGSYIEVYQAFPKVFIGTVGGCIFYLFLSSKLGGEEIKLLKNLISKKKA